MQNIYSPQNYISNLLSFRRDNADEPKPFALDHCGTGKVVENTSLINETLVRIGICPCLRGVAHDGGLYSYTRVTIQKCTGCGAILSRTETPYNRWACPYGYF